MIRWREPHFMLTPTMIKPMRNLLLIAILLVCFSGCRESVYRSEVSVELVDEKIADLNKIWISLDSFVEKPSRESIVLYEVLLKKTGVSAKVSTLIMQPEQFQINHPTYLVGGAVLFSDTRNADQFGEAKKELDELMRKIADVLQNTLRRKVRTKSYNHTVTAL